MRNNNRQRRWPRIQYGNQTLTGDDVLPSECESIQQRRYRYISVSVSGVVAVLREAMERLLVPTAGARGINGGGLGVTLDDATSGKRRHSWIWYAELLRCFFVFFFCFFGFRAAVTNTIRARTSLVRVSSAMNRTTSYCNCIVRATTA